MADTKISELPVATAIASPDVAPIVQGGVTKQADVSLFGGPFLSANVARVDPSGNDGTGTVGDLNKPFLTVQAAINTIEALTPIPDWPVIDIGNNDHSADVLTTSLKTLVMQGSNTGNDKNSHLHQNAPVNAAYSSLTFTESTAAVKFVLKDCIAFTAEAQTVDATDGFTVYLINSDADVVKNMATGGNLFVYGYGGATLRGFFAEGTIEIHEVPNMPEGFNVDPTTTVEFFNCPNVPLGNATTLILNNSTLRDSTFSSSVTVNDPKSLLMFSPGSDPAIGLFTSLGIPTNEGLGLAGKGSICMDTANGKLYVNGGDAATPDWRLVVSV